jgi:hypothetical protein
MLWGQRFQFADEPKNSSKWHFGAVKSIVMTALTTAPQMHRIGGIPDNCKCLWIQVDTEPAGVQLLFLG